MFGFQMRRAFERHRAADMDIGRVDLRLGVAEEGQKLETRIVEAGGRDFQRLDQKIRAEREFVEHEFDVEGAGQGLLQVGQLFGA